MSYLQVVPFGGLPSACFKQAEGFQKLPEPRALLLWCGPSGVAAWSARAEVTTEKTIKKETHLRRTGIGDLSGFMPTIYVRLIGSLRLTVKS